MSVLKQKRTTSKAEFINTANQIYVETLNFLTRLSARYSRLIAEPVAKLAGEIIRKRPTVFSLRTTSVLKCGRPIFLKHGLP